VTCDPAEVLGADDVSTWVPPSRIGQVQRATSSYEAAEDSIPFLPLDLGPHQLRSASRKRWCRAALRG
jgi:hypothetical protein